MNPEKIARRSPLGVTTSTFGNVGRKGGGFSLFLVGGTRVKNLLFENGHVTGVVTDTLEIFDLI